MRETTFAILLLCVMVAGCAQSGTAPTEDSTSGDVPAQTTGVPSAPVVERNDQYLNCQASPCGRFVMAGSEPFIAADPQNARTAVVAAHYWAYGDQLAHPWMGVARTTNAGNNWTIATLPGSLASGTRGGYDFAADPMVVYRGKEVVVAALAGHGTAYRCVMANGAPAWCGSGYNVGGTGAGVLANALDVVTWVSNDGGMTFGDLHIVHGAEGAFVIGPPAPPVEPPVGGNQNLGTYNDKEFLAADSVTGRLHLAWNTVGDNGYSVLYSRSDDALQWTEPTILGEGFGAWVAARNGTVLVSYRNVDTNDLLVARSPDGGATWEDAAKVGTLPGYETAPIAMYSDASALFVYPGANRTALELLASNDAGKTWSSIGQALPGTSTRRLPALALDDRGYGVLTTYMEQGAEGLEGGQVPWGVLIIGGRPTVSTLQLSADPVGGAILDYMGAAAGPAGTYWAAWMQEGDSFGVHAASLDIQHADPFI